MSRNDQDAAKRQAAIEKADHQRVKDQLQHTQQALQEQEKYSAKLKQQLEAERAGRSTSVPAVAPVAAASSKRELV